MKGKFNLYRIMWCMALLVFSVYGGVANAKAVATCATHRQLFIDNAKVKVWSTILCPGMPLSTSPK